MNIIYQTEKINSVECSLFQAISSKSFERLIVINR